MRYLGLKWFCVTCVLLLLYKLVVFHTGFNLSNEVKNVLVVSWIVLLIYDIYSHHNGS
jgi:hypothetical protein